MARPREFDEQKVLDRARQAFWANGVAATSISNLSDATGLSVGSIYKAFNSKSELCQRTLEDYLHTGLAQTKALLTDAPSAREGLQAWLDAMAEQAGGATQPPGCYAVVCTVELAPKDPAVKQRLQQHDRTLRQQISDAVRAVSSEEDVDCDPDAGAMLLTTTVNGLQVEARKGLSFRDARRVLTMALDAILPPSTKN